jgi:hypothetical protein
VEEFERLKSFSRSDEPIAPGEVHRSHEYGSTIIHSMATGRPSVVYGNMPNRGAIGNLPADAIAEAPTLVDRSGPHFTTVGDLPPQLVAYMNPHVTQHELFIRAAMEGRRDHVYQAAMFDPLTAATLPPDRIVELCDEMIAAHGFAKDGGLLPDLDAKRTLVPSSGKRFPRVKPEALRSAWERSKARLEEEFIRDWHVIGPFKCEPGRRNGLELKTAIEEELAARGDGSVELKAAQRPGGAGFRWSPARAGQSGYVDLAAALGRQDWVVAYGYAEVHSAHARECVLRCGSDDGIKLWLNGKLVHAMEVGRAYAPGSDEVPVQLRAGVNRLLVKVDNYSAGWGFGVAVPGAE